jgi:hypothetical protein
VNSRCAEINNFAIWEICRDLLRERHSRVVSVTAHCEKPESPWIPPFESAYPASYAAG